MVNYEISNDHGRVAALRQILRSAGPHGNSGAVVGLGRADIPAAFVPASEFVLLHDFWRIRASNAASALRKDG